LLPATIFTTQCASD
ncbi:Transcription-repair-coupling factor, partial [Haemophilus influenzae]